MLSKVISAARADKLPQIAGNPHEIDERSCKLGRKASRRLSAYVLRETLT